MMAHADLHAYSRPQGGIPSTPYEAPRGLLIQAIRDNDPVMIFCEHKNLYGFEGEVPENSRDYVQQANMRDGRSSIVTYGLMVHRAGSLRHDAREGRHRSGSGGSAFAVAALDIDTVLETVENTGRLVVVDEASPRCNIATDISAQVSQQAFGALKAGIQMVAPPHTPVPFSPTLEDLYIPSAAQIVEAARKTMNGKGGAH